MEGLPETTVAAAGGGAATPTQLAQLGQAAEKYLEGDGTFCERGDLSLTNDDFELLTDALAEDAGPKDVEKKRHRRTNKEITEFFSKYARKRKVTPAEMAGNKHSGVNQS